MGSGDPGPGLKGEGRGSMRTSRAAELCRSCLRVEWGSEPSPAVQAGLMPHFTCCVRVGWGLRGAGEPEARPRRARATRDNTEAQKDFTSKPPPSCEKSPWDLVLCQSHRV